MVCCFTTHGVVLVSCITPRASVSSTKHCAYEYLVDGVSLHDLAKSYSTMLSICISTVLLTFMIPDASSQALAYRSYPRVTSQPSTAAEDKLREKHTTPFRDMQRT